MIIQDVSAYRQSEFGRQHMRAPCSLKSTDMYHVHFEVHNGNTPNLSLGNNDVLGSISPYRLTQYIGEGDPLPGEEQYW